MLWAVPPSAAGRPAHVLEAPGAPPLVSLAPLGFDVVALYASDPDGPEGAPPAAEVVLWPGDARRLQALGYGLHAPARPGRRVPGASAKAGGTLPPGFGQGQMGGWFTLSEIEALVDQYAAAYPSIVSPRQPIGVSVEGRSIWAVWLGDQPGVDEGEPAVLLDALQHAREPAGAHALLVLLHRLATAYGTDPEITSLLDERSICLVPVANPDGYVFNEQQAPGGGGLWRKNRRPLGGGCFGVDLNRNFPEQWGADDLGSSPDPCSAVYRGPAPLSEPESAALDLLAQGGRFDLAFSLHSFGRLALHPFGHAPVAAPFPYAQHAERFEAASGYRAGAVFATVGPANGNWLDRLEAAWGTEAWALEIGGSFWPDPAQLLADVEEAYPLLLDAVRLAGPFLEASALAVHDPAGDGDGHADPGETVTLRVAVSNAGRAGSAGGTVTVTSSDPFLAVSSLAAGAPGLGPLQQTWLDAASIAVSAQAPPGHVAVVNVTVQADGLVVERDLALVLASPRRIAVDDFESDLGWTYGVPGDTATTGVWTRADPIGIQQGGEWAQPESDTTPSPGVECAVTGNGGSAPGQDDVDDGVTTLVSPPLDLGGAVDPRLRYRRFYWNSKADDPLLVEISGDGGASWVLLESVNGSPNEWTEATFRLADYVSAFDRIRLRVRAQDPLNTSVTEAALDDVEIFDYGSGAHVLVFGQPAPGRLVEVQLGSSEAGTLLLLAAAKKGPPAAVFGVKGVLELDVNSLVPLGSLPLAGPASLGRLSVSIPSDPSLVGLGAALQGLFVAAGGASFTPAVEVTIEAP